MLIKPELVREQAAASNRRAQFACVWDAEPLTIWLVPFVVWENSFEVAQSARALAEGAKSNHKLELASDSRAKLGAALKSIKSAVRSTYVVGKLLAPPVAS